MGRRRAELAFLQTERASCRSGRRVSRSILQRPQTAKRDRENSSNSFKRSITKKKTGVSRMRRLSPQHAAEDGDSQRPAHFGTSTTGDHQRDHTENERE